MTALDVAGRLEQAKAKMLITDASTLSMAEEASVLAGCVSLITLDQADQHTNCMEDLIKGGDPSVSPFEITTSQEAESHNAFINRTSGSTRKMKSIITTHAHYIATLEATRRTVPSSTDPDQDQWLSSLSLGFFINAKLHMSLNVLLGIPVVLMNKPFDEESIPVVKRHSIPFIFLTPPIAAKLARSDLSTLDTTRVKWLLTAGAPMHTKLREAIPAKFCMHLTFECATSEMMLIAIQVDEESRRPGSSGTLVAGVQAKVIDTESGDELGQSEEGELLVRNSLAHVAGYKDDETASQAFDSEDWFYIGDYSFLDDHGNVFMIDRLKELLRAGDGYGSHVSASELETVVFEHPSVASVIVVEIHNDHTQTDEPTTFVLPRPEFQAKACRELAEEIGGFSARMPAG